MVERFLIWCSGAKADILFEDAPTDRPKHVGIGGTVLFTGLLAIFSGGYAVQMTFQNYWISIPFGILWGLIIFNLDRYIVSSMRKTGDWRSELAFATPRFLLALVLAVVVSKPIELRLFDDSISTQFKLTRGQLVRDAQTRVAAELASREAKKDTLIQKLKRAGTIVTEDKQLNKTDENVNAQTQRIENIRQAIKQNQQKINANMVVIGYDSLGTPRWGPNSIARSLISSNRILQKDLALEEGIRDSLLVANRKLGSNLANNSESLRNSLTAQIAAQDSLIAQWRDEDGPATLKADTAALSSTMDLPAKIDALSKLSDANEQVKYASWLITLLFILLECSPVIVKLLSNKGPYDIVLERMEYEVDLAQKKIISDLNDEVNNRLKEVQELNKLSGEVRIRTERSKLDAELRANEALLQQIASRQADLAQIAVDKWYKEEKARLVNDDQAQHVLGSNTLPASFLEHGLWKRSNGKESESYLFNNGSPGPQQPLLCIKAGDPHKGTWQYVDASKQAVSIEVLGTKDTWTVIDSSPHRMKLASPVNGSIELLRV